MIHPTRAARIADLTLKIQEVTAEIKTLTKPMKILVKQLKKAVSKILEKPDIPLTPEDEQIDE